MIAGIGLAALLTEPTLAGWRPLLLWLSAALAVIFTAEYVARLWVKPLTPGHEAPWGWLVYATRWHALIDLVALVAIWVELFHGYGLSWAVMLRLSRILRIFALTRESSIGMATRALAGAVRDRRIELALAGALALIALVTASVALYLAERAAQPEQFGSIPRAMWWAATTLTTVGYGDAIPVTAWGKIAASAAMFCSFILTALPAGILAAAFSDAFQRARQAAKERGPDA